MGGANNVPVTHVGNIYSTNPYASGYYVNKGKRDITHTEPSKRSIPVARIAVEIDKRERAGICHISQPPTKSILAF